jgi:formate/nitrite transporter FocA (FNT family)
MFAIQFMAGMLLSVGGLLSQIAGGGIGTVLTTADPSIPKIFAAAVFPVGLIMFVYASLIG